MIKKIFFSLALCTLLATSIVAQNATYHLPKTTVKMYFMVERTTYTPGDLAPYAARFLKENNVSPEESITYKLLGCELQVGFTPDEKRVYTAHIDQKHNIQKLAMSEDNTLLAVNTEGQKLPEQKKFTPAPKPAKLDPYKYLNQDILSAGSKMKMAELCANEIYDIRESKNELNRGQADYMPKDGAQLKIMLNNLNTQDAAITQLFCGTTVKDTTLVEITYIPEKEVTKQILFRFSTQDGFVDADDLSGEPYFVTIKDLHSKPERIMETEKPQKDETGIWVALPGKIRLTLSTLEKEWKNLEFSAAQFGDVENLNDPLFTKKVSTSLILNPNNGGIAKIESTPLK